MLGLNCKKGAAKAILPGSCWSERAPTAPTFLQPEAVLQNRPRKEETRAKGREGGQEGSASHQMRTQGTAGGKHTALLQFAASSSQTCSDRPSDRSQHSSWHQAQRPASPAAPASSPPAVGDDGASLLPAALHNIASAWLGSPRSRAVHGTLPPCSRALPQPLGRRAGVAVLTALPATGQAVCAAGRGQACTGKLPGPCVLAV